MRKRSLKRIPDAHKNARTLGNIAQPIKYKIPDAHKNARTLGNIAQPIKYKIPDAYKNARTLGNVAQPIKYKIPDAHKNAHREFKFFIIPHDKNQTLFADLLKKYYLFFFEVFERFARDPALL